MSNEHRHEFIIAWGDGEGIIFCRVKDCKHEMPSIEAIRRMNATECLSAEDARHQATEHDCMEVKFRSDLFAYADTLEGKND